MNQHSAWRVELAREIAAVYTTRPGIEMIAIGGSVGHDIADAYSDMDMGVYWRVIDVEWLKSVPLRGENIERFTFHTHAENVLYVEQYFIGCAKVDIAHMTMDWWEQIASDVLDRYDTDGLKQDVLDGFLNAIPLYGEPQYEQWRARVAAYPDGLVRKMVEQHAMFYPKWVLREQGLERGELFNFYDTLCGMIRNLFGTLAGLNRIYVVSEKLKHLEMLSDRMKIAPPNLRERVHTALTDREQAPEIMESLISDTLGLIETHLPDFDTSRKRWVQALTITPCIEKPAFLPDTINP